MDRRTRHKIKEGGIIAVVVIGLIIVCYGISWIVTCGIIKLITLCFGLQFKWTIATGVWIILCTLQSIFKIAVNNKN